MGLLDSIFDSSTYGGQSGGLLDMLKNAQMQNNQYQPSAGFGGASSDPAQAQYPGQTGTMAVGNYQMPQIGGGFAPQTDGANLPQNAQSAQGYAVPGAPQAPQQAQQQTLPSFLGGGAQPGAGFGDRLSAGLNNFAGAGGLLPALAGGINGLMTGNRTDPQGMAQQNLKAQYDALLPTLGPQKAMLAVMNPEAGKILLAQALEKKQFGFTKLDDGTIVRQDPLSGTVEPAYQGKPKPTFGIIGEADGGGKAYGFIDQVNGKVTPYTPTDGGDRQTITGPDGKPIPIPPGVDAKTFRNEISRANAKAAAGEKTEVQAKSEKFGNKMENAEKNLKTVEGEGTGYMGRMLEGAPLVGGTAATNWAQSEGYQKYKQARDNFITALLRDESGAAIGTSEFQRYEKELFPQPGDSNAVIEQKRDARRIAIEAMKKSAGPGYKSPDMSGGAASASAKPADPLGIR